MTHRHAHHLQLDADAIKGATIALLPGDPGRVPAIAAMTTNAKEIANSREFRSFLGWIEDQPILVTSTGCGGPSTALCAEELAQLGVRTFIRVGSTGAIQEHIKVRDVVITQAAVRLEGASRTFAPIEYPAVADLDVVNALVQAAREDKASFHVGITASTDNFYQGQERYDSYSGFVPAHLRGSLSEWRQLKVANFEMEAATLLTMCATMGLRAGCICGVVANRTASEKVASPEDFKTAEQTCIRVAVAAAAKLLVRKEQLQPSAATI
jgi:uridine phosphorylase